MATAIMIFFSTLKLLEMNKINPHVKIFFDTCTRIRNFLPAFLISCAVLMLAFGHCGYIAFGSDSWDYSTVPRALRSQFLMLMGKPMPKADLERADPIIVNNNNNNNNNNNSLFDPIMKNTIRNTIFENKLRYGHPKKPSGCLRLLS